MNFKYQILSEKHLPCVDAFSCIESDEVLSSYTSKERRRIKIHSKEMQDYLKFEAFNDQIIGVSTTHLLINTENNDIVAYISLCNDAIKLEIDEVKKEGVSYQTIPSLKIARLAVSTKYQHNGIGKQLVSYAALIANEMISKTGIYFITLDCYEHRRSFYEKIGFVKNQLQPITLPYDSPNSMRLNLREYLSNYII